MPSELDPVPNSSGQRTPTFNEESDGSSGKLTGRKAVYVKFIQSCYANHPEAFSYFEQLVVYIGPQTKSPSFSLQEPKVYELLPVSTCGPYPLCFPFQEVDWDSQPDRPRVVVLEGFPSPDCVAAMGAKWSIRPEFFLGNIDTACKVSPQSRIYELPTLHSRQENVVHIQFASIAKKLIRDSNKHSFSKNKLELENACRQSQKTLFLEQRFGVSRFRKVYLFNSQFYATEQMVSLTVAVSENHWTGKHRPRSISAVFIDVAPVIFLTDQSKSTQETHHMPWNTYNDHGRPIGTLPLVPFNAPTDRCRKENDLPGCLDQFHPLKNIWTRDRVDGNFLFADPFFLFGSVLEVSALSWTQVLNLTAECVLDCQEMDPDPDQLNATLDRLRHFSATVHRIEEILSEKLPWIEQGGCATWPKATGQEVELRKRRLQNSLLVDYERLLKRCSSISRDCESATNLLVGYSQLLSSERSNQQASEVTRLSKLASFFVPFGSVASIFGMNVKEMQNFPRIWIFATLAIGVSALTLVVLNWNKCWSALRQWRRKILGAQGTRLSSKSIT
jgi:hypothetical protein